MSETDFLRLITELAKVAKPMHRNTVAITSLDEPWANFDIDSMDCMMLFIYVCEVHQIPEEVGKQLMAKTGRELLEFVQLHKAVDVEDIDAAVEACQ